MTNLHSRAMSKISIFLFVVQLTIPSATPLSFKFPTLTSDAKGQIVLANSDSYFSPDGLQLTPDDVSINREQKAGRATYVKPLQLWDSRSKKLTSFTTTFKFVINANSGGSGSADGLTFFLAENNTQVTSGGALGLPVDPTAVVSVARFVAVEFDTYGDNEWDPKDISNGDHVGININSLTSVAYEQWSNNVYAGLEYEATVSYYSVTKVLSVVFTGYQGDTKVQQDALRYTVDLSKELPEWVIFGFTAATGGEVENHTLKSWTFKSSN